MIEETANNTNDNPTFNLQDLVFTLSVYEICTQRGCFKADELSTVGAVYDRLQAFLIANNAIVFPDSNNLEKSAQE
jgi:hypothetical protein